MELPLIARLLPLTHRGHDEVQMRVVEVQRVGGGVDNDRGTPLKPVKGGATGKSQSQLRSQVCNKGQLQSMKGSSFSFMSSWMLSVVIFQSVPIHRARVGYRHVR